MRENFVFSQFFEKAKKGNGAFPRALRALERFAACQNSAELREKMHRDAFAWRKRLAGHFDTTGGVFTNRNARPGPCA
ncbi:MAG: hypothetical protein ACTHLR_01785 [Rhizomicrobium sp.]